MSERASERTGPLVVIIGPPGSGKTTVAGKLARRLGVPARDTDEDVEARTGRTITEIFAEDGEPAFRELEHEAVIAALAEHSGVLALGGGSVLDPRVEAALAGHRVVFLDVLIADAARRIGFTRSRPLLLGNPRAQWTALMEHRRPIYQRIATLRVPTDGQTPAQVVDAIVAALELPVTADSGGQP